MGHKIISHSRIIRGLFIECQREHGLLMIAETKRPSSFRVIASSKPNAPFQIELEDGALSFPEIGVSFWLKDELYKCVLVRQSSHLFHSPSELERVNRRSSDRLHVDDISATPIICVLRLPQRVIFGQLEDLSAQFLGLEIGATAEPPGVGQNGTLLCHQNSVLIGAYNVTISHVRPNRSVTVSLVLQIRGSAKRTRALERVNTQHGLSVQACWPNSDGLTIPITIDELTGIGCSGHLPYPETLLVPVGSIFQETISGARIRLTWCSDDRAGFSFDTAEPATREKLFSAISANMFTHSAAAKRKYSRQTLSVLTRSGLLKGDRALSFADPNKQEWILDRASASRLWLYSSLTEHEHISFARITDGSWIIQELGSLHETPGSGRFTLETSITSFLNNVHEEPSPSSRIIGIYDLSSSFNHTFWKSYLPKQLKGELLTASVVLGSVRTVTFLPSAPAGCSVVEATNSNWASLYKRADTSAAAALLAAFGLTPYDYFPRHLRDALLQNDNILERRVFAVQADTRILGFMIQLGLPALSNATSLLENAYLIPLTDDAELFLRTLFAQEYRPLFETEDIAILGGPPQIALIAQNTVPGFVPREFELACFNPIDFGGPSD